MKRSVTGYIYILKCADSTYYTGSTKYLAHRIYQHKKGEAANYTAKRRPIELLYIEIHAHIGLAFEREKQIQN